MARKKKKKEEPVVEVVDAVEDADEYAVGDETRELAVPSSEEMEEVGLLPEETEKAVDEPPPFRGYRITGQMRRGFWAVKRKFLAGKPVDVPIEDLDDRDILELEQADSRHLIVERIGLDSE